jgi:hypothetical protein
VSAGFCGQHSICALSSPKQEQDCHPLPAYVTRGKVVVVRVTDDMETVYLDN